MAADNPAGPVPIITKSYFRGFMGDRIIHVPVFEQGNSIFNGKVMRSGEDEATPLTGGR
jgi:hypothetical protein